MSPLPVSGDMSRQKSVAWQTLRWDLPVAVVGEFIVAGEGDEHPEPNAQREAHLGGGVYPHLCGARQER